MPDRYAVVIGEALVDMLENELDGDVIYRPAIGGAPLNVAVGLARLGAPVRFAGSVGNDLWGERIRAFLRVSGVDDGHVVVAGVPTTLAVATFSGSEPDFRFYGEPPSYGFLSPDDLDVATVEGAALLYCGSIALLCEPVLAAARQAWAVPGPVRVFDPNVRARLLTDVPAYRAVVDDFAATAALVKISAADAAVLYGDAAPRAVAEHLLGLGAGAVVVTRGGDGALLAAAGEVVELAVPRARAVDATGAGDATMAGLLYGLFSQPVPADIGAWLAITRFAMTVAAIVVESPGGATAMPRREQVLERLAEGLSG
ncbi:MAG TPA: carbohydrate kinase [Micromonosporaceae bacterium]|nr:carbohydrate kinase [Micromonosporaceae bacterium]